jgi:hypothetical protein
LVSSSSRSLASSKPFLCTFKVICEGQHNRNRTARETSELGEKRANECLEYVVIHLYRNIIQPHHRSSSRMLPIAVCNFRVRAMVNEELYLLRHRAGIVSAVSPSSYWRLMSANSRGQSTTWSTLSPCNTAWLKSFPSTWPCRQCGVTRSDCNCNCRC